MVEAKVFYIDKTSGTSADTLLAIGFASLLGDIYEVLGRSRDGIIILDVGPYYEITLPVAINTDDLLRLFGVPMLLPLTSEKQRDKQAKKGGKTLDGFDYDGEMERSRSYRERIKNLPPELQTPDARLKRAPELEEIIQLYEPDTRLSHYQAINQMKIASSFNDLAIRWSTLTEEQMRWHIDLLFKLFHQGDNDIAAAIGAWQKFAKEQGIAGKAFATALQIINSTTGKGANRAKANELTIGNQESFWLLELLKFKGFMEAAAPLVIKESKDRKTYVLLPQHVELATLQYMMSEFRAALWPTTALKLDILASLRFAQVFVEHRKRQFQHSTHFRWKQKQPLRSLAQGFEVAFYKDMGSAYATMNVASINLPTWLPAIDSRELGTAAEELLSEHIQIIQHIRNSKGEEGAEEYELLRFYRDFLSGNDLRSFWKFTTAYSSYLMSQREKEKNPKRQIRQLSYKGLETLLMSDASSNKNALEIVTNKGFQHIADAIRRATVFAQYRRSQHDDKTYEVRYGLGQELMRKARYNHEFLIALSEFLFEYEAETAREDEKAARDIASKTGQMRPLTAQDRTERHLRYVTSEDDLKEVVALVDKYGAELVGSLLVACGYSFKGASANTSNELRETATIGIEN